MFSKAVTFDTIGMGRQAARQAFAPVSTPKQAFLTALSDEWQNATRRCSMRQKLEIRWGHIGMSGNLTG